MAGTKKEVAIRINNIKKEFILPQSKDTSLKQAAVNIVRKKNKVTQKVLDGVTFDINKGDFFGIVGRNGSGKSTLLKLIAGVYYPTAGSIELNGGLTPFIELGVGFNPELSGKDNIYLNGALLGFTREQMAGMYEDIVEFAELGPFMDQKLKNYSSGMQVRLAFSIAIKAKNDILIFDEVLAVGDEAFQRKCLDVFEDYKRTGQTVILVTHDMSTVERFCNRAALISEGKLIEVGDARKVSKLYSKLNNFEIDKAEAKKVHAIDKLFDISLLSADGKKQNRFKYGEKMTVKIKSKISTPLESMGVSIFKRTGEHITGRNSRFEKGVDVNKNKNLEVQFTLDITPGVYFIYPEAFYEEGSAHSTDFEGPTFTVEKPSESIKWSGIVPLGYRWKK